jgi:hypothetical protein
LVYQAQVSTIISSRRSWPARGGIPEVRPQTEEEEQDHPQAEEQEEEQVHPQAEEEEQDHPQVEDQ